MAFSTNDGGNNINRKQSHEWEHSSFAWENIKDGIFEKIETEDPHFFSKERRPKLALWVIAGAAFILLSGAAIWTVTLNHDVGRAHYVGPDQFDDFPIVESPLNDSLSSISLLKSIEIQSTVTSGREAIKRSSTDITYEENKSAAHRVEESRLNFTASDIKTILTDKPDSYSGNKTQLVHSKLAADKIQNLNDNQTIPIHIEGLQVIDIADPQAPNSRLVEFSHITQISMTGFAVNYPRPSLHQPTPAIFTKHANNLKNKTIWNVSLQSGAILSFSKYQGTSSVAEIRNDNTSASFGYQYGLVARATMPSTYFLIIDVNRNVTYQNIDVYTERTVDVELEGALLEINHFVVGDRTSFRYGDTTVAGLEQNRIVNYNSLKSINGGIGIGRIIGMNAWTFSPSLGVSFGLMTSTEGYTVAEDKSIIYYNNDNPIHNAFQFRTWVGFEFARQLSDRISLLVGYRFDKQWNNASVEPNLVLRPGYHRLTIGASLKF
jgi:hypothetical protein